MYEEILIINNSSICN